MGLSSGSVRLRLDRPAERSSAVLLAVLGLALHTMGCGDGERTSQADAAPRADASMVWDAGAPQDGGPAADTGVGLADVGVADAGPADSGEPESEVLIPAGQFTMGGMGSDETERQITITRAFMMQVTEVTQDDWSQFFPDNPSTTQVGTHPVERISWYDALAYANALSSAQGLTPCYDLSDCSGRVGVVGVGAAYLCSDRLDFSLDCDGYRLPTEAEWEYAARLGFDDQALCEGDEDINLPSSRCGALGYTTHPVRSRAPDATGLYGTRGNTAEWTWDWFDSYRGQDLTDPTGPSGLSLRVTRGGGWTFHARGCRSTHRAPRYPSCQTDSLGLRLVRSMP